MDAIIALDIGTSSMRAIVFGVDGILLHQTQAEYHTIFPQPSHVEQDPLTWRNTAFQTLSEAGAYLQQHGYEALAVTVTSQRASMIPMDADGNPLYNAIMWQDKRTISVCDRLYREYGMHTLYRRTGLRVNPFFVLNKIIWLRENMPEVFNKTEKFIGVQDYVIYQLTGKYVTDWTQASRTMLMDLASFNWEEELLRLAGISEGQLCNLVPPGSVAGYITKECAAHCGLKTGLPVVVSGGDQQNAAIALGVVHPGMAEANTGTGSFVLSYSGKPVFEKDCRVLCQASAVAGGWMTETAIFNTGAIYRWCREQFYPELADREDRYHAMNRHVSSSPVGSNGVLMLPHYEGSAAPYWNPMAKGVFFNLGLGTTLPDIIRSVMEGIALEIAENLSLMRGMIGDINKVSVAGGMVRSDTFCHIQADAYNAEVLRTHNTEASALGACINACVTLGVYGNHGAALGRMLGETEHFTPNAANHEIYQRISARRNILYNALNTGGVYEAFMGSV